MRNGKLASISTAFVALGLVLGAVPLAAQEAEEFPGSDAERPLEGYTRADGTIVLDDESFCRFVLSAALGEDRLTYVALLDKSKKQKRARKAAFTADSEAGTLARCVDALSAFGSDQPEEGELPGWALRTPVVPDSLASLLPEDFVAQPLAQPDEIGAAARTSGSGDLISAPFSVAPGPWLAELHAVGCATWEGVLRDARAPERVFALGDTREYLYELDAGHYYWDVTAPDCDWSVDLVPVVLGPEPTPTPAPRAVVPALYGPEWNRYPDAPNEDFLTPALARDAVHAAGLTTGECHLDGKGDRISQQQPIAGTLVEYGTLVDVWVGRDCDIYLGDRIVVE